MRQFQREDIEEMVAEIEGLLRNRHLSEEQIRGAKETLARIYRLMPAPFFEMAADTLSQGQDSNGQNRPETVADLTFNIVR